jgi:competence protein ComEC
VISDDIGTTIAAQVATIPILVGSFGTYGLLSILVNALVLWTIPPLMVLGGVGGLLGLVWEPLGSLLLALATSLLWFFTGVVQYFGGFGWQISIGELPIIMIVGYYLVLGSWIWIIWKKRKLQKNEDQ